MSKPKIIITFILIAYLRYVPKVRTTSLMLPPPPPHTQTIIQKNVITQNPNFFLKLTTCLTPARNSNNGNKGCVKLWPCRSH
jgi:hypothetical protein